MNIRPIRQPFQVALTVAALLAVVGGLILTEKAIRLSNIQSCLSLAQHRTTTRGTSDSGEWSVEDVSLNNSVYQECMSKKRL